MISCRFFYDSLVRHGIDFFVGVPDSLLKSFCAYLIDSTGRGRHIIVANEGGGIGMACGHYLATGRPALVYMQNSGQGNAINPLVSLADPDVYGIPMLLLIGWRGEPGRKDEPQHIKQGKVTLALFDTLDIPYWILPERNDDLEDCLKDAFDVLVNRCAPVALIVRKGTFEPYQSQRCDDCLYELTREEAIRHIANSLDGSDIIVSTTGKTSRELYEYRDAVDGDHSRDFLTVGSMGHCSQIAMGIALAKPDRQVYCFDGDGAVIMHMGALTIIGAQKPSNFKHIIFNNGAHDSVGGQPTAGLSISFTAIAKACGYKIALEATNATEVGEKMEILKSTKGPVLLEIKVKKGARSNLGRPKSTPEENKVSLMRFLSDCM